LKALEGKIAVAALAPPDFAPIDAHLQTSIILLLFCNQHDLQQ
jgi:hypothetical protein